MASSFCRICGGFGGFRTMALMQSGRFLARRLFSDLAQENLVPTGLKLGFIGIGNMGSGMVSNLLKHGEKVLIYDPVKTNLPALESKGARIANSLKDVAKESDVIISMIPGPEDARKVYLGVDGLFRASRRGTFFIDSSTIGPVAAKELISLAAQDGHMMIDAPVSGFVQGAVNGTLTFMVGGEESLFQRAKPLFRKMGKNIFYCGPAGNGQSVKICNNTLLGISMVGVSEVSRLAESLGLNASSLFRVVNTSSGRCWSSDTYNPVPGITPSSPSNQEYAGGFSIDLIVKDMSLAMDAASSGSVKIPMGNKALSLFKSTQSKGCGHLDFGCVYKFPPVD